MLDKPYYLTTGVQKLPFELVELILGMIEKLIQSGMAKDYLQTFNLFVKDNTVHIVHKQEVPAYMHVEKVQFKHSFKDITGRYTIFVIDDGEYATMMLSEEY